MIVTAFLGFLYIASPIWFKLNNFYNNNNNKNNTSNGGIYISKIIYSNNPNGGLKPWTPVRVSNYSYNSFIVRSMSLKLQRSCLDFPDPTQKSLELEKFLLEKNLNPVFIYENLSNNTIKTLLKNETRNLSGIYLILNKFTLDYYIGSASTGRFHARFSNHLFNFHGSKLVKYAVKKHGVSSFAFMVLELFPDIVNKQNNKRSLDLEDFYLKSLLPNYNILTEAGSSFGYKHSEITRLNMKANYSEERRMAIGSLNKDRKLSPSTIELMKQAALNRTKPIYTVEAIKNMKVPTSICNAQVFLGMVGYYQKFVKDFANKSYCIIQPITEKN